MGITLIRWAAERYLSSEGAVQTRQDLIGNLRFASFREAAQAGRIDVLGWYGETCETCIESFTSVPPYAAAGGQLHVLQWFKKRHDHKYRSFGFDWWDNALQQAGGGGNLNVLQWLEAESRQRSHPGTIKTNLGLARDRALKREYMHPVEFIDNLMDSPTYRYVQPRHVALKLPELPPLNSSLL